MSQLFLQIVDKDGIIARIPAGGPLEADLIEICVRSIMTRSVGVFRTAAQVEVAVRDGIRDGILEVKRQTRFIR